MRTEKELAAVRMETAQATATARAARMQSKPQPNQHQKQQQQQQQPSLVPPSPTHVTINSDKEGVMEGGDGTISIPATKYVTSMNAVADC